MTKGVLTQLCVSSGFPGPSLDLECRLHIDFKCLVLLEQATNLFVEGSELLKGDQAILDLCVPQVHKLHVHILVDFGAREHIWIRIRVESLRDII